MTQTRGPHGQRPRVTQRSQRRAREEPEPNEEKRPRRTAAEIAESLTKRALDRQARPPSRRSMLHEHLAVVLAQLELEGTDQSRWSERQRKAVFIEMYREFGNVMAAGALIGVRRAVVANWRKHDGTFRDDMDHSYEDAVDTLELELHRRGVEGVTEVTVTEDEDEEGLHSVSTKSVHHYSDSNLQFLTRAARPGKYRERVEHSTPPGQPMELTTESKIDVVNSLMGMITPKKDPETPDKKKQRRKS